jgi:nitrate reductase delta subunit
MNGNDITTCYRLVSELLLHPRERDAARVGLLLEQASGAPAPLLEAFRGFLGDPQGSSNAEYIQTLELTPPCPLYLGSYLFEEPTSCRGVGVSGRNLYMIELRNIYRHFGFEMVAGELPDFLPIVVDFLWISDDASHRDSIGLRRYFIEHFVNPALDPLRSKLEEYESVYVLVIEALMVTIHHDLLRMAEIPAWVPPKAAAPDGQSNLCEHGCSAGKPELSGSEGLPS